MTCIHQFVEKFHADVRRHFLIEVSPFLKVLEVLLKAFPVHLLAKRGHDLLASRVFINQEFNLKLCESAIPNERKKTAYVRW